MHSSTCSASNARSCTHVSSRHLNQVAEWSPCRLELSSAHVVPEHVVVPEHTVPEHELSMLAPTATPRLGHAPLAGCLTACPPVPYTDVLMYWCAGGTRHGRRAWRLLRGNLSSHASSRRAAAPGMPAAPLYAQRHQKQQHACCGACRTTTSAPTCSCSAQRATRGRCAPRECCCYCRCFLLMLLLLLVQARQAVVLQGFAQASRAVPIFHMPHACFAEQQYTSTCIYPTQVLSVLGMKCVHACM